MKNPMSELIKNPISELIKFNYGRELIFSSSLHQTFFHFLCSWWDVLEISKFNNIIVKCSIHELCIYCYKSFHLVEPCFDYWFWIGHILRYYSGYKTMGRSSWTNTPVLGSRCIKPEPCRSKHEQFESIAQVRNTFFYLKCWMSQMCWKCI